MAIDGGIATESMDDREEELARTYVDKMKDSDGEDQDNDDCTDDDDVIVLPDPVLIIREAYVFYYTH